MREPPVLRVVVDGDPTDEERHVLERAAAHLVEQERNATAASMWLRASRAKGRRLGMLDYRDRFARADAWRLSTRFPFGGREYPGLTGRADAR